MATEAIFLNHPVFIINYLHIPMSPESATYQPIPVFTK